MVCIVIHVHVNTEKVELVQHEVGFLLAYMMAYVSAKACGVFFKIFLSKNSVCVVFLCRYGRVLDWKSRL